MLKVKLCNANSLAPSYLATAICVGNENKYDPDVLESLQKGFDHAIEANHLSVLEHTSATWMVEGLSRACTHQLVRHRIASYSQQSQRYCKLGENEDWYVIPPSIGENELATKLFHQAMNNCMTAYKELIEIGIPKEDARFVLPNACSTKILITMNMRAFIEAAEKRLCSRAQWEIRNLFNLMRDSIKYLYPMVYRLAVPRCAKKGCIEYKPCGNPWKSN